MAAADPEPLQRTPRESFRLAGVRDALVVEDEVLLCGTIAQALRDLTDRVDCAHTVAEALGLLWSRPQLVILDVRLPDGDALDVLRAGAELRPSPVFVAVSGVASPEEAFHLAQLGVRGYLAKPFRPSQLVAAVCRGINTTASLDAVVAGLVGRRPLREIQADIRHCMIEEALARSEGSLSGAARLLGVSRQAVQQIVRERRSPSRSAHGTTRRSS